MADDEARIESKGAAFRAGPPERRTPLRDNLESIVIAIVLVLCMRQMVVEAFRIRHGSMAPTLIGDHKEIRCPNCGWAFNVGLDKVERDRGDVECPNCRFKWSGAGRMEEHGRALSFGWPPWLWNRARTQGGQVLAGTEAANRVPRDAARIFVNKFVYRLRDPRRWEVIVFIYPSYPARCTICDWRGEVEDLNGARCPDCGARELEIEAKNYIKRVVGLPGERVSLRNGDVYVNGSIRRKPAHVQRELWFHVFDSRFMPRREVMPLWEFAGAEQKWLPDPPGGVLEVDARGAGKPLMAEFARPVTDFYPYDGVSFRRGGGIDSTGRNRGGDCRIRARVRLLDGEPGAAVMLAIEDAGRGLVLSLSAGPNPHAVLTEQGVPVRQVALPPWLSKEGTWIGLENYDDRAVASIAGREVLRYEYEGEPSTRRSIRFGARNARLLWQRIVIERDIHYTHDEMHGEGYSYQLGPQEYFVLGDNSPASSDSRRWERPGIPEQNIIGRAVSVFWPVHHMKWLASP